MKTRNMTLSFALFAIVAILGHARTVWAAAIDLHTLLLGDGKVSSYPEAGYVYSCHERFRGGGARHDGPWIHSDTWDATEKIHVQGDVNWQEALFRIHTTASWRDITATACR